MSEGVSKGLLVAISVIGFAIMVGLLMFSFTGSKGTVLDFQRQICKNTPGIKDADCNRRFPDIDTLAGERYVEDIDDFVNNNNIGERYRNVVQNIVTNTSSTVHITKVRFKGDGSGSDVWINHEEGPENTEFLVTNLIDDLPLDMRNEVENTSDLFVYGSYEVAGVVKQYLYISPGVENLSHTQVNDLFEGVISESTIGIVGN